MSELLDVAVLALGIAWPISLLVLLLLIAAQIAANIVRARKRQQSMKPRDQIGETIQDNESRP